MAKTVTLKAARAGSTTVRIGERTFPLDVAVKDVPDSVVEQLKAMPGVQVRVASGTKKKQPKKDNSEPGGDNA